MMPPVRVDNDAFLMKALFLAKISRQVDQKSNTTTPEIHFLGI